MATDVDCRDVPWAKYLGCAKFGLTERRLQHPAENHGQVWTRPQAEQAGPRSPPGNHDAFGVSPRQLLSAAKF